MQAFNKYFDHTLLKPDATPQQILKLVSQTVCYDFASVCVNGCHVSCVRRFIDSAGSGVKVAAVAGFPLGAMDTRAKAFEVQQALEAGADEIDLVMNIGQAKAGNWAYVEDEIFTVSEICHEKGALLKVIIETCLLTENEIIRACRSCAAGEADFVKTSTGFSGAGADADTVRLMKETLEGRARVKASGGIRTLENARAMIQAGADRLGCSASVEIMEEYRK
ncbi:MAG: deoxyribose-phosphate aldolase [Lentihominibacter sp.]